MSLFQRIRRGQLPAVMTVDQLYALTEAGIVAEKEHLELIDGEIVPMAAAKASRHEWTKARLNRELVRTIPDDALLYVEASITLSDRTLVEPDIAILPFGLASRDARGPDLLLVVEVSDSSLAYDLRVKVPLYASYGAREYWVVDALRETIRVHRRPAGGTYEDVEEYERHEPVAALLPGVSVTLDALG